MLPTRPQWYVTHFPLFSLIDTANLAAILTQQAQKTSIASLEEALAANYRICSERKNLETVRSLYPDIEDRHLVVDPVSLGGDGKLSSSSFI